VSGVPRNLQQKQNTQWETKKRARKKEHPPGVALN
jgi:hypothetical protein